jgi:hypothetical protein
MSRVRIRDGLHREGARRREGDPRDRARRWACDAAGVGALLLRRVRGTRRVGTAARRNPARWTPRGPREGRDAVPSRRAGRRAALARGDAPRARRARATTRKTPSGPGGGGGGRERETRARAWGARRGRVCGALDATRRVVTRHVSLSRASTWRVDPREHRRGTPAIDRATRVFNLGARSGQTDYVPHRRTGPTAEREGVFSEQTV